MSVVAEFSYADGKTPAGYECAECNCAVVPHGQHQDGCREWVGKIARAALETWKAGK